MDFDRTAAILLLAGQLGYGQRAARELSTVGSGSIDEAWLAASNADRERALERAEALRSRSVNALTAVDAGRFPPGLVSIGSTPPFLFWRGNLELMGEPALGVCGSRDVTARAEAAVSDCAKMAVERGRVVVSGYARGADMAAHRAALESGGATIIVLSEGIAGFSIRRALADVFDWAQVLVVSQFSPDARWTVSNAMARNATIVGLSTHLLAMEAGDGGGTLNAGRRALSAGVPLAVPRVNGRLTPGGELLTQEGARIVDSRVEFSRFLETSVAQEPVGTQGTLV